jgi:hypothetical protein
MGFDIDYKEASEGSNLLPVGEYETVIKFAGEDVTKSGTVYISVILVVRNDVEQRYQNKVIFHALWMRISPSPADASVGGYSVKQIQTLSKAAGLPNGKKYDSVQDWYDDLKGKVIRVTIKHEEYPEGSGIFNAKVNYVNPSKFPECKHVFKSNNPASPDTLRVDDIAEEFVEIVDDDDLPF